MHKREIALFFAGVLAWESFTHLMLYLLDSVPFEINGWTIGLPLNTVQIVFPAIISFILVRYANWLRMNRNR
jgi:hypothetical protein